MSQIVVVADISRTKVEAPVFQFVASVCVQEHLVHKRVHILLLVLVIQRVFRIFVIRVRVVVPGVHVVFLHLNLFLFGHVVVTVTVDVVAVVIVVAVAVVVQV